MSTFGSIKLTWTEDDDGRVIPPFIPCARRSHVWVQAADLSSTYRTTGDGYAFSSAKLACAMQHALLCKSDVSAIVAELQRRAEKVKDNSAMWDTEREGKGKAFCDAVTALLAVPTAPDRVVAVRDAEDALIVARVATVAEYSLRPTAPDAAPAVDDVDAVDDLDDPDGTE